MAVDLEEVFSSSSCCCWSVVAVVVVADGGAVVEGDGWSLGGEREDTSFDGGGGAGVADIVGLLSGFRFKELVLLGADEKTQGRQSL